MCCAGKRRATSVGAGALDSMCGEGRALLTAKVDIGIAIHDHWAPVFHEASLDRGEHVIGLGYVTVRSTLDEWSSAWRADLSAVDDLSSGIDGLPHLFWPEAPEEWTARHDGIGVLLSCGCPAPSLILTGQTVCIPKGEYPADTNLIVGQAPGLRLTTLMNTEAKVLARQAGRVLVVIGWCGRAKANARAPLHAGFSTLGFRTGAGKALGPWIPRCLQVR